MRREIWRHFDFLLLGAIAILIIFGVAMIRSAIAGNIELIELNIVRRQIIYAGIGFGVILIITLLDYRLFVPIGRVMYLLLFILLLLILGTGGEEAFGATRWLDLGIIPIQPSELAKITIILMLADFLARNQEKLKSILWVGRSILLTLGLMGLIILQPDLSTSIVLLAIWFALLWAAGLQLKHLGVLALIGMLAPIIAFPFLAEYQQQRIVTFLFPNPEARYGAEYNVNQALITLGSGGWLGQGYTQGSQVQLRYLKVRHNDFIFSAIGEEFGFVGNLFVILLLFFVIWRVIRAARLAYDTYGALICYGVATLISFHIIVNVGMNLNLMPVTGLPLPFVSYGGSSLVSMMIGIGLVESVVARHKVLEF